VDSNKESLEKEILEEFMLHYPDFPKGKLVKSESPDFILKLGPRKAIGIEITTLADPVVSQRLEAGENRSDRRVMLEEKVKNIIRMKEEKLRIYRKKRSDYYWLIIACDIKRFLAPFRLPVKVDTWCISSEFNRVFLFESASKKVYILT